MGLFSWIIVGFSAGWMANFFFKRRSRLMRIARILAGIAGALTGGFLTNILFFREPYNLSFAWQSILVSLLCAIVLIGLSFKAVSSKEYSY